MIPKGTVISGPDGQSFTVTADIFLGDAICVENIEAGPGMAPIKVGDAVPQWLMEGLTGEDDGR